MKNSNKNKKFKGMVSNGVKKISKIFILSCTFVLFFLVTPVVIAAPSISGVSGTTSQGNMITITGSGFGTKSPAAPIRWETWENGTLGQAVSTAGYWSTLTNPPTFSSDYLRHSFSSKSSKHYFTRGMGQSISGSAFWKGNLNFGDDIAGGKIFMSSWTRWKDPTVIDYGAQNTCQIKFFRIDSTQPGGDTPTIMNGSWYYPDKSPGNWYNMVREDATYQHGLGHYRYNDSQWNHVAVQIYTGTRGNSNGSIKNWDNGNQISSISNALFYINGYTKKFQMATFQFFMGNCYEAYTTMYTDDIYLDNTWARVEIGNASTYDASSHREMLIPQTWSASQITATLNQGSFANGSQAYIFVVDSDGNASPGRAITISGTLPPAQSCGDQTCNGTETCSTCSRDCGTCSPVARTYSLSDFTNLVADWLKSLTGSPGDVNLDNKVNSRDLGIMMSNWAL